MTTKVQRQKDAGKNVLIDWAKKNGFAFDRWGNLKKVVTSGESKKEYRIKLNPNKARYEVKAAGTWVRIKSGAYKDFVVDEGGSIHGFSRKF